MQLKASFTSQFLESLIFNLFESCWLNLPEIIVPSLNLPPDEIVLCAEISMSQENELTVILLICDPWSYVVNLNCDFH